MNTIDNKNTCEEAMEKFWKTLTEEAKSVLGKNIALQVGLAGSTSGLMTSVQTHVAGMDLFSEPVEKFADVTDAYITLPDAEKKYIRDSLAEYFLKHNRTELRTENAWDYKKPAAVVALKQAPIGEQPGVLKITTPTIPPLMNTEIPKGTVLQ